METSINAWHWLGEDRRIAHVYPDVFVEVGKTYTVEDKLSNLKLYSNGMHASTRAVDSLMYAPGPTICRVHMSGEIINGYDKLCASERTVIWMADATRTLHEFAIWCARGALERERALGREPDPRSWLALEVKQEWLDGKITATEWDAAVDAARAATWAAARADAVAAAGDATKDVISAVRNALISGASYNNVMSVQNVELTQRLMSLAPAGVTI